MRVLALENKITNEYIAFVVNEVVYDEDFNGMGFWSENEYSYIPNVSLQDFNYVCQKIVLDGFCDVTRFGEIMSKD